MSKAPVIDMTDPDGLVRSQALQTDDRAFRITLNSAESHWTFAGAFLAESFGALVSTSPLPRMTYWRRRE
jgi:4-hydroxyphenylpyruvate dioxygenase